MEKSRSEQKVHAAYLSVGSNTSLSTFKLFIGLMTGSVSIIAEALHSMNDLIASVIATYAVKESSKPPDREHEYGHGKAESISALLEAALIIFAAVFIIYEAADRLLAPRGIEFIEWGIAVMFASTVVNAIVSLYLYRIAKKTNSAALHADAAHLSTDVITSLGVFAGLFAIRITGYMGMDPVIAMIVALFIIQTGLRIILGSCRDLMDTRISIEEEKRIREILELHKDRFFEFHRMRTRRSGSERHMDLHLVVPRTMSVQRGHALADHIEKEIMQKMPETQVLIHIEPCHADCDDCSIRYECDRSGYLEHDEKEPSRSGVEPFRGRALFQ
jgi:cation diffusion facilitator family transporter